MSFTELTDKINSPNLLVSLAYKYMFGAIAYNNDINNQNSRIIYDSISQILNDNIDFAVKYYLATRDERFIYDNALLKMEIITPNVISNPIPDLNILNNVTKEYVKLIVPNDYATEANFNRVIENWLIEDYRLDEGKTTMIYLVAQKMEYYNAEIFYNFTINYAPLDFLHQSWMYFTLPNRAEKDKFIYYYRRLISNADSFLFEQNMPIYQPPTNIYDNITISDDIKSIIINMPDDELKENMSDFEVGYIYKIVVNKVGRKVAGSLALFTNTFEHFENLSSFKLWIILIPILAILILALIVPKRYL
jgi:hypothetical protein